MYVNGNDGCKDLIIELVIEGNGRDGYCNSGGDVDKIRCC